MTDIFKPEPMSDAAKDTFWCLFKRGPTWDGNLPSKKGRDWLVQHEYAARGDGWNLLTSTGVSLALEVGFGNRKERGK